MMEETITDAEAMISQTLLRLKKRFLLDQSRKETPKLNREHPESSTELTDRLDENNSKGKERAAIYAQIQNSEEHLGT